MKRIKIIRSLFLSFLIPFVFQLQGLCFEISNNVNSFKQPVSIFLNRIEGRVYDPNKNPVPNADVELLNDVYGMISHTKTNSSGQFSFMGVTSGKFIIKVSAFRLNLREETQTVEIIPARSNGSITEYADFYMRYDKQTEQIRKNTPAEVIFVQEVPQNAKDFYEKGLTELDKNPIQAIASFEEAVKFFPTYFDALSKLGNEYIQQKNYEKSYPFLLKAIDINPRSFSSYYNLGFAFYQIKQIPASLEALKGCLILDPNSINANLLYGTILRINGSYNESEKTLLKTNTLTKGKSAEVHMQLALLYNKLNRNQEAINELETYLKLEPKSPEKSKIEETISILKASVNKPKDN